MFGAFMVLVAVFVIGHVLAAFGDEDAKQWVKDEEEKGGDGIYALYIILFLFFGFLFLFFKIALH